MPSSTRQLAMFKLQEVMFNIQMGNSAPPTPSSHVYTPPQYQTSYVMTSSNDSISNSSRYIADYNNL